MPLNDVVRQGMQPFAAAVTSNRVLLYCAFSTFAVIAAVANACRNYSNFYSVAIYLSRSSRSVLLLANFGFLCALLCGRVMQRLFFGPLQPREVERLYDQTWMFVTESLLAFTIFRDEFDVPFLLMFGFLLFIKCFHWLMADRVESMDQTTYPGPPTLFHIRINALFGLLWMIDIVMFAFAIESTMVNGVGGMVLFASEYGILMASALNAMARYVLSILDLRRARARGGENAPPWEHKSMYIFYIELVTDFLKLSTYLTFFMIILTFYGLPLNIIRDVYLTARSFITRLRALIRYHNATRDMDRRYPDATEAELAEMSDRTCIICREEMHPRNPQQAGIADHHEAAADAQAPNTQDGPNMSPKKLPCGHIFHFQCLRSWLERQQSCPTCRRTVLETNQQNQAPAQGRPGARPPLPRPGAPPLAAQGGQAPVGGPLGWLGRLLGITMQPALPAPPFPHGQFLPPGPVPQPNAPNGGWPAQPQPGVFYPFQLPLHPPPQQQLQPPPIFRGFYGPAGWQPWVPEALVNVPPQQQPGHPPQEPSPQSGSVPPSAATSSTPAEIGRAPVAQPQHASSLATPTSTMTGDASAAAGPRPTSESESLSAPRDAAALAALRRLNPSPAARAPAGGPSVRSDNDAAEGSSNGSGSTHSSFSTTSTESSPSAATAVNAPLPTPTTSARPDLPPLIPLYDTGNPNPPRVANAPSGVLPYSYGNATAIPRAPYYRGPSGSNSRPYAGPPQPHSHPQTAMYGPTWPEAPQPTRYTRASGTPAPRQPLSQLPPTLTDEQLARLDRLTRDAIDERLRVLEGVSSAIYRCMDELTRVRSVLPTTGLAGLAQEQRRAPESAAAASSSEASAINVPTGDNAGRPVVVPEANAIPSASSSPGEASKEESASEEQLEVRKEDAVSDSIPEASPPTGA